MTIKFLKDQGGLCPVCLKPIDSSLPREAVMDHDHNTGQCRGVLHRSCNAALGKVDNAAGRWGAKSMQYSAILPWLKQMIAYYESPGLPWIYPTHKTPEQERLARNLKERKRRASAKARQTLKTKKE